MECKDQRIRHARFDGPVGPMKNQRASVSTGALLMLVGIILCMTIFPLVEAAVPAATGSDADPALAMRARHQALREPLSTNVFQRPLVLESNLTSKDVKGDIYAVVPYSYAKVSESLSGAQAWCDILILHLNTKSCKISREQQATALLMNVGKKFDQPLEDAYLLTFAWQLVDRKADYLRVLLTANSGPLSTRDYRILLEMVPLENGKTFIHLSYAYGFGLTGKLAMGAYFSTVGRDKVGFSVVGKDEDGKPAYIDGMRGLVERNTMRYYLAIESYLGALALPESAQFEKRIADWFDAVERYPRQLHEMGRTEYLTMKRKEYRRQKTDEKPVSVSNR